MQLFHTFTSFVSRPIVGEMAWQFIQVQTVYFHCSGVSSTNQISERFTWQLYNFSYVINASQYDEYTVPVLLALGERFVRTPSADLCATATVPSDKTVSLQARTCSRVAV